MSHSTHKYIVSNISLPVDASVKEAFSVVKRKFKKLGIGISDNKIGVYRRSIDARKKNDIKFVYSIYVDEVSVAIKDDVLKRESITEDKTTPLDFKCGDVKIHDPVIVVGSGPCGLFCSLLLAEAGYPVVLLEKGGDIAVLRQDVNCGVSQAVDGRGVGDQSGTASPQSVPDRRQIVQSVQNFIFHMHVP